MFSQGFHAIRPRHSLSVLASWRWLMLADIAFILLQRAGRRLQERLLLDFVIDLGYVARRDRAILYDLVQLIHGIDHSIRRHPTQLRGMWSDERCDGWPRH